MAYFLKDMNFVFEWLELNLTCERSKRVGYCFCHKILFLPLEHKILIYLLATVLISSMHFSGVYSAALAAEGPSGAPYSIYIYIVKKRKPMS